MDAKRSGFGDFAYGSLWTEGRHIEHGPPRHWFKGHVTCIAINGPRVTVGALGHSWRWLGPGFYDEELSGSYIQLLTVEFGEFKYELDRRITSLTFGGLGDGGGVPALGAPNCGGASFAEQELNLEGWEVEHETITLSPTINPLPAGYVSKGSVTLSGTGEADQSVTVYEVGDEAGGVTVPANSQGDWAATLSGLAPGRHVFTAADRSNVTATPVTVDVLPWIGG